MARCVTPILWIRRDSSVAYANPAACQMLGYQPDEIRGVKVADFDPTWTEEYWEEEGYASIQSAGIRTFESTVCRRTDGRTIPVEVTANHVELDGEPLVFAFLVEITERKER